MEGEADVVGSHGGSLILAETTSSADSGPDVPVGDNARQLDGGCGPVLAGGPGHGHDNPMGTTRTRRSNYAGTRTFQNGNVLLYYAPG